MSRPLVRAAVAAAIVLASALSATAQDPAPVGPPGPPSGAADTTDWRTFVPPTDGSFSTWEGPPETGLVTRLFQLSFAETCGWALGTDVMSREPQVFDIAYRESYDEAGTPDRLFRLYQFFCSAGAYNEQYLFLGWDEIEGTRALQFAEPSLDIKYVGGNFDGPVESIAIIGFGSNDTLTNAVYDEASRTLTASPKWRGLGDASSTSVYALESGQFVLKTYDVDASYDGEINPVRALDYGTSPVMVTP